MSALWWTYKASPTFCLESQNSAEIFKFSSHHVLYVSIYYHVIYLLSSLSLKCLSDLSMWHFTSTLAVTTHKINASSLFATWRDSALHVLAWLHASTISWMLNAKDVDVTSLPKYWWNVVYFCLFLFNWTSLTNLNFDLSGVARLLSTVSNINIRCDCFSCYSSMCIASSRNQRKRNDSKYGCLPVCHQIAIWSTIHTSKYG